MATKLAKLTPRPVVTWDKVQRIWQNWEIWKDKESIVHKLPEHYKRRYWENILKDKTPVHYEPPKVRFEWDDKKKIRIERENIPILTIYPPEADRGLWGGEGIVKGYFEGKPKKRLRFKPTRWYGRFWYPELQQRLFYSEILNKYLLIWSTRRTAELIDEHQGFDYYILKTPEIDLASKFGNRLKRELYLTLARGEYYPGDEEKRKEIEEKYKNFFISVEEAEWIALDLNEACRKLQDLLDLEEKKPLKFKFEGLLVNQLRQEQSSSVDEPETPTTPKKTSRRFFNFS